MNPMMDRYMNRDNMDGRNPYGSRGGYVTSRRPRGGDRSYEYEGSFRGGDNMYDRDYDYGYDIRDYDYDQRDMRDYGYDRRRDGRRGGRRDYADYGALDPQELEHWKKKLMSNVNDSSKEMLSEQNIMKKAKEYNIKMDKFSPDEFVVTVLMMYTDYWKTVGRGNIEMYVKMAEDFLCDEDAAVKGGEKLAAYYNSVVNV